MKKPEPRLCAFQIRLAARFFFACAVAVFSFLNFLPISVAAQQPTTSSQRTLTPLQLAIEKQRARLASNDAEERRDAVMRLGWMNRAESSRVAAGALHDTSPIVRGTAARAVLSLPPDEAAASLIPLLQDREEFVRQQAAYALGETRSRTATAPLVNALIGDKQNSVRGAAAVSLGLIRDDAAVVPLSQVVAGNSPAPPKGKKRKGPENEFVRRAAVIALGQIGSRAGVPALIAVLTDERASDDVRREAARSLGLIGDPVATASLRSALTARDPYLSRLAYEALRKISPNDSIRPGL